MSEIELELKYDDTCDSKMQSKTHIKVNKEDIFTFGVFNYEIPPPKLGEDSFEYLNSKIPGYRIIYEDYIEFDSVNNRIINNATGEMAKDVSEIVGIGVGLKTSIDLFNYKRKDIVRIDISSKKEKRLDFKLDNKINLVEIETKGTVIPGNVPAMIKHTHEKKVGKTSGTPRYGLIIEQRKDVEIWPSVVHITDPEGQSEDFNYDIYFYLAYYVPYFMFILDNQVYNKVIKKIFKKTKFKKYLVQKEKIKYSFLYEGRTYLGQCFDNRLIIENIAKYSQESENIDQLFNTLTDNCGMTKYFLGIDTMLIDYFNQRLLNEISNYTVEEIIVDEPTYTQLRFSDGMLFIKSKNGALPQINDLFPEQDVKTRLKEFFDYEKKERHACGAPCRSKDKEGKPCDIMTYRSNCHFHR